MKPIILPKGISVIEDELMIDFLCKDQVFIESIEAEFGKIESVYADWHSDALVYRFIDGEEKCSDLTEIIRVLHSIDYLKAYEH